MPLIETLETLPSRFTAGDTVLFNLDFSDYPASAYDCAIHAVYQQEKKLAEKWRPAKNGDVFEFQLSSSQTAALPQGGWTLEVEISELATGHRKTVSVHALRIEPKPGDVPEPSFAEQMVAALEKYLLDISTNGQESTTVRGQSMSRMTATEATALRDQWKQKVKIEKQRDNAARGGNRSPFTGRAFFGR